MKLLLSLVTTLLAFFFCQSQDLIEPGGKGFNAAWFKPRNIFEKLTWMDKVYWIDVSSGEILKHVFTMKDGSVFMKSKI